MFILISKPKSTFLKHAKLYNWIDYGDHEIALEH